MSRPCCLAMRISASASEAASCRRRAPSSSASSRIRAASSVASRSRRWAVSSARARILPAASRAAWMMRAVSSPSISVIASSSRSAGMNGEPSGRLATSRSRNRSRSWRRDNSAATIRRKSRTSVGSNPRRLVGNEAPATAAGDDGSGRENEIATDQGYGIPVDKGWQSPNRPSVSRV